MEQSTGDKNHENAKRRAKRNQLEVQLRARREGKRSRPVHIPSDDKES